MSACCSWELRGCCRKTCRHIHTSRLCLPLSRSIQPSLPSDLHRLAGAFSAVEFARSCFRPQGRSASMDQKISGSRLGDRPAGAEGSPLHASWDHHVHCRRVWGGQLRRCQSSLVTTSHGRRAHASSPHRRVADPCGPKPSPEQGGPPAPAQDAPLQPALAPKKGRRSRGRLGKAAAAASKEAAGAGSGATAGAERAPLSASRLDPDDPVACRCVWVVSSGRRQSSLV
jgi:hypothetical protein